MEIHFLSYDDDDDDLSTSTPQPFSSPCMQNVSTRGDDSLSNLQRYYSSWISSSFVYGVLVSVPLRREEQHCFPISKGMIFHRRMRILRLLDYRYLQQQRRGISCWHGSGSADDMLARIHAFRRIRSFVKRNFYVLGRLALWLSRHVPS